MSNVKQKSRLHKTKNHIKHIAEKGKQKLDTGNLPLFVPYALRYEENESLLVDAFCDRDRCLGGESDGDLEVDRALSDILDSRLEEYLRDLVAFFVGLGLSKSSS